MRRTKEDAQVTRQIILDAALRVFYLKGFSATSINDICIEAGVTKGALYWHFESKELLFIEMLKENLQGIIRLVEYYRNMNLEPDEKLKKIYTSIFEWIIQNKNVHRAMDILISKTEMRDIHLGEEEKKKKELLLNFTDIIQEGMEKGIFKNEMTPLQYNFYLNNVIAGLIWGAIEMPNMIKLAEWGPKYLQITFENILIVKK
ncbi:MAG: TetR/AcrR family transcriptional regulator [Candidatus Cloacimonetes bacterium]|nr:TetR/AcrR family transcriptional regulator [Candidatus Cloacimonadota bacterium]